MVLQVPGDRAIGQAVRILRRGGLVAFPTETYFGLAVDPFNVRAVERLFQVKHRPRNKPMLVLVETGEQINMLAASIPDCYNILMEQFWPGPLTLVFPARSDLSRLVTGGLGTIGIRKSPHPTARALVHSFGGPVTATSANRSGGPPALSGRQVRRIFGNEVDMVLEAELPPCREGSTLVGCEAGQVFCIREGRIPFAEVKQVLANTGSRKTT